MSTADDLLAWATSKIGTLIPTPGVPFAVPNSCSLFTSAGYEALGIGVSSEPSPAWQAGWFQNNGRYDVSPSVGAQWFGDLTGQGRQVLHTGFVTAVYPDGSVDTIENNAGAHDGHPNGVFPNHRGPVGDGVTLGYGHPPYTTATPPSPPSGLRTMYDSTTAADIPADAQMVGGYLNGRYAWSDTDWARFPNVPHVGIVIHIPGQIPPNTGDVLDVEAADAPGARDVAATWVAERIAAGAHPTIYTSVSTARYFVGLYCTFWLADYTATPHMASIAGMAVVATQYASPEHGSGGHYDLSLVADDWHPASAPTPTPPAEEDNMKMIVVDTKATVVHPGLVPHWEVDATGRVYWWNGARALKYQTLPITAPIINVEPDESGNGLVAFADDARRDPDGSYVRSTYTVLVAD